MRKVKIVLNEYYHIYNRGNNKQPIFLDNKDKARFLFLILYFQSPTIFYNISRFIFYFVKHSVFNIPKETQKKILNDKMIELISFVLMPNHFHLILCELKEGGISQYMQRVLNAYTKYFNKKHDKSGHLFQGPFQVVHVKNNEQLLYLSTYIHKNPRELVKWKNKEHLFFWSSYQDYLKTNRWGEFLTPQIISEQFTNWKEYEVFVKTSIAKEKSILDEKHFL